MQTVAKPPQHWGRWVEERGRRVGFLMRKDFAAAVGSTTDQLAKWLKMPKPPTQMRKGFDDALARALKTNRQTLFVDYASVAPEDATHVWAVPGENLPWDQPSWRSLPAPERFLAIAALLPDSEVETLLQMMQIVVQGRQDQLRRAFDQAMTRHENNPSLPPPPKPRSKSA